MKGIWNDTGGTLALNNSTVTGTTSLAISSGQVQGVLNRDASARVFSTSVSATTAGSGSTYGIYNQASAAGPKLIVENSRIAGTTSTVYANTTAFTIRIGATHLEGGSVFGTATCVGTYDANFNWFATGCP